MIGAIIGDIVGSRFEKKNVKSKDFKLFKGDSKFTDDTVLTVAIADCILNEKDYAKTVKNYGRMYPFAGYGGTFRQWLAGIIDGPYNSWGNGSAMRVSPIGGDSDTIACMTGSIAEAFYKEIPEEMVNNAKARLPDSFIEIIELFGKKYPCIT